MINQYQYNPYLLLINLFLWLLLVIRYWRSISSNRISGIKNNYSFFILIVLIYSVFAFSEADTYHYHRMFDELKATNVREHVEPFYFWLIQVLPQGGYYIWRLIVWGLSLFLMIKTFRRIRLDSEITSLLFSLILLSPFVLTRGTLGFSLLLYSTALIFYPGKSKLLSVILGIIGICLSIFLHKSIIAFLAVAIFSLLPTGKTYYWVSVLAFPVLYKIITRWAMWFLGLDIISDETSASGLSYLDREVFKRNFLGQLQWVITYLPLILSAIFLVKSIIYDKMQFPKYGKFLFRTAYNLLYIGLLFYNQEVSAFISSRFLHASYFFMLIPTIVLFQNRRNKWTTMVAVLYGFACLYNYVYHFYSFYKVW